MARTTHIPPINDRIRELAAERAKQNPDERGGQSRLADKCKVSRNAVSSWFSGASTPGPEHWPALVKFFGVPADTFQMLAADYFMPGIKKRIGTLERALERSERRAADMAGALRSKRQPRSVRRANPSEPRESEP